MNRSKHKESLRASEQEAREILDRVPAMISIRTEEGIAYTNKQLSDYVGAVSTDLRDGSFLDYTHPDDREILNEHIKSPNKGPRDIIFRVRRKDGVYRWFHTRTEPSLNEDGSVYRWYALNSDIDDLYRSRELLKERELQLSLLTETLPAMLWKAEPDGTFVYINRTVEEFTGCTLKEIQEQGWVRLVHPDDVEETLGHWNRLLEGSDGYNIVHRLLGKNGLHRWSHTSVAVVRDDKGKTIAFHGVVLDMTAQKEAETARLEERTRIARELHDTLLQTFQSASLHLGAALYHLGEDSPVKPQLDRTFRIMTQGIAEGRDAIQGLRSPDTHASDLILALSQIREEFEVHENTEFCVKVTGTQTQFPQHIQHEIYRIAREALANAFHHSGAKRVKLEAEYSGGRLCIRIRDDGCGIDPQVLKKGREGHWGLIAMRERATRIGARLKILSRPTHGTEVRLYIPTGTVALGK